MNNLDAELLTQCDKEQIQYIDSIQPTGSLVATDAKGTILYAALGPGFDVNSESVLNKNLKVLLGDDSDRVLKAMEDREEPTTPILIKNKVIGKWLTCIGHKQDDIRIFELELSPDREINIPSVKFMNERHSSLQSYLSFIVENIQMVTGYDRVMIYRFAPDWHGEVVAESIPGNAQSFFGHHFPSSDIPLPARDLFTKIWSRMISDIDSKPLPVVAFTPEKLDLTKSVLRATSPIHLEYLRNMGVKATLTLSLVCDGKLWGLIACHHLSPKNLVAEERSVCSLLAKLISSRITTLAVNQSIESRKKISEFISTLEGQLETGKLQESIRDNKNSFLNYLDTDSFSFVSKDSVTSDGHAPSSAELIKITDILNEHGLTSVQTDSIARSFPDFGRLSFAGLIGAKVENNWLLWTRREVKQTILWAGAPTKNTVVSSDGLPSLSPRLSFDTWKQSMTETSVPWVQNDIDSVDKLAQIILRAMRFETPVTGEDQLKFQTKLAFEIKRDVMELEKSFKHKVDGMPPVL